MKTSVA